MMQGLSANSGISRKKTQTAPSLISANQLGNGIAFQRFQIEQIFPTPDDHAELRPPIADVIVANNVVAEEFRDAREGVAQESAADVTDMHRLGHVGRTEIDHDFFR